MWRWGEVAFILISIRIHLSRKFYSDPCQESYSLCPKVSAGYISCLRKNWLLLRRRALRKQILPPWHGMGSESYLPPNLYLRYQLVGFPRNCCNSWHETDTHFGIEKNVHGIAIQSQALPASNFNSMAGLISSPRCLRNPTATMIKSIHTSMVP